MVTASFSFLTGSRMRDEATFSKTDLYTVFSHSTNGGATQKW